MSEMEKEHVGWSEVEQAVDYIAESVPEEPDQVIGIARGGLPLAVPLCHRFDTDLDVVYADHYDGDERDELHVENFGLSNVRDGDTVLLVDDIVDTGKTMGEVVRLWEEQTSFDFDYYTAVWHEKPSSLHVPHVSVERTEKWIVYPWE